MDTGEKTIELEINYELALALSNTLPNTREGDINLEGLSQSRPFGLKLAALRERAIVARVRLGSPAHLLGVTEGSSLVAMNGEDISHLRFQQIVAKLNMHARRRPLTLRFQRLPSSTVIGLSRSRHAVCSLYILYFFINYLDIAFLLNVISFSFFFFPSFPPFKSKLVHPFLFIIVYICGFIGWPRIARFEQCLDSRERIYGSLVTKRCIKVMIFL